MFVAEIPIKTFVKLTGRAMGIVTSWFENFCDVCTQIIANNSKMLGTADNPIQIDEARFTSHCKYNCGQILAGEAPPTVEDVDSTVVNKCNHGARVDGLWVFGLQQGNNCQYFLVE